MATWDTVQRLVGELDDDVVQVEKGGHAQARQWKLNDRLLAWERPLRKSDLEALGDDAPKGDILAVYVPDLETKDAMVTHRADIYFTTPHFKGYAIVLVRLGKIGVKELRDLLKEGWHARAPKPKPVKAKAKAKVKAKATPKPKAKATKKKTLARRR